MQVKQKIIIAGGGAAGFFAAIHVARLLQDAEVCLLEKSSKLLSKVRISGGGRCNVTHACFDNRELIKFYPRGGKSLLGPFSRFTTTDTIAWFKDEGVILKTEEDGRMFPVTDNSETIIDALMFAAKQAGVRIEYGNGVKSFERENAKWRIETDKSNVIADAMILATGSSNQCWKMIGNSGIKIINPVPSLFTFHIPEKAVHELSGVSVPFVKIKLSGSKLSTEGPLLFTHWGFSGPAALKLSAFAARELAEKNYQATININFLPSYTTDEVKSIITDAKMLQNRKLARNTLLFEPLSRRVWEFLLNRCGITETMNWSDVPNKSINKLVEDLVNASFVMNGKSTFKDEFVTCGGVSLDEIDLRNMQSKKHPGLFFCGETVNVDAITGGFNFQWAWTSGFIAAQGVADYLK